MGPLQGRSRKSLATAHGLVRLYERPHMAYCVDNWGEGTSASRRSGHPEPVLE